MLADSRRLPDAKCNIVSYFTLKRMKCTVFTLTPVAVTFETTLILGTYLLSINEFQLVYVVGIAFIFPGHVFNPSLARSVFAKHLRLPILNTQ